MILSAPESHHIDELFSDLRERDREVMEAFGLEKCKAAAAEMSRRCVSQVFLTEEGKTAALWIALSQWDGVMEIIAYTGNEVEKNKAGFYKACLRGIDYLVDFYSLHRLQCYVWGDYDRSVKWLQRLGFEIEGVRKQFGPNRMDATMMGRVF